MRGASRRRTGTGGPQGGRAGLFLTAALLAGSVQAAGVPFAPTAPLSAGEPGARVVAAGDLDRDGDRDVVSGSASEVAWHENDPSGWTRRVVVPSAATAAAVHLADLDRDGDLDLVVATKTDDTIVWHESDGARPPAFTAHPITTTADDPRSVATADLDGDGDLDLLAASFGDDRVTWYENDGTAPPGFSPHTIATDRNGASAVVAGDVDRDGDLDVLAASALDDTIAWYESDGASPPAFGARVIATGADFAVGLAAVDFDRDGDLDALSASSTDDTIAWYENDGATPPGWTEHTIAANADAAVAVGAADIDDDGDLDAVAVNALPDDLVWYERDGAEPPAWTPHVVVSGLAGLTSMALGDLDGDGDLDLLSAAQLDGSVNRHENRSIHRRAAWRAYPISDDFFSTGPVLLPSDFDGDGDEDLYSMRQQAPAFIHLFEHDGALPPSYTAHELPLSASHVASLAAADLDSDGDEDVVWGGGFAAGWVENDGPDPALWTERLLAASKNNVRAVGDLDSDGDPDLVMERGGLSGRQDWYENDGASPPAFTVHLLGATMSPISDAVAADVDGDGDLDLVGDGPDPLWFENDGGSPPLFTQRPIGALGDVIDVDVADLDGDGDLDVLAAENEMPGIVAWFENDGARPPAWTMHTLAGGLDLSRVLRVGDPDDDGDPDVMASTLVTQFGHDVLFHEHEGSSPPAWVERLIDTSGSAPAACLAEIDGDGRGDFYFYDGGILRWYRNVGGPYTLETVGAAPPWIPEGGAARVLDVTLAHEGRPADGELAWSALELLVTDEQGTPLDEVALASLVGAIRVHADDGSGTFDAGDALVAEEEPVGPAGGILRVDLPLPEPLLEVAPGASATFFVVLELGEGAGSAVPEPFVVTHLVESGGSVVDASAGIELRRGASLDLATSAILAARDSDGDGTFDPEDPDDDADGRLDADDCAPLDDTAWSVPTEVTYVAATLLDGGLFRLEWSAPTDPGGTAVTYDTLISMAPYDFVDAAMCLGEADDTDLMAEDVEVLLPGEIRFYLTRAGNVCSEGSVGNDSSGTPRAALDCPAP